MLSLVRCSSTTPGTGSPGTGEGEVRQGVQAYSAVTTDPNTAIAHIDSEIAGVGPYDILVTNKTGYIFTCPNDPTSMNEMELAAGFTPFDLAHLPAPVPLNDDSIRALFGLSASDPWLHKEQLISLPCATAPSHLNQDHLFEFDLPMPDAGAGDAADAGPQFNRRLFVNLGDTASGKPILHNVGCGELITAMGLDVNRPVVLPLPVKDQFVLIDDQYDISCHAGQNAIGYQPALIASVTTQSVGRTANIVPVTFSIPPNDVVPPGGTLKLDASNSTCFPLTIDPTGWTVTGQVPPLWAPPSCTASFYVVGPGFQTKEATITINTACQLGTVHDCSACNAGCSADAGPNASPVCESNYTCGIQCNPGYHACHPDQPGCQTQFGTLTDCAACLDDCTNKNFVPPNAEPFCNTTSVGTPGWCSTRCKSGFGTCADSAGACVALNTRDHCGGCNACPADTANNKYSCVNGACVAQCIPTTTCRATSGCGGREPDGCGGWVACPDNCADDEICKNNKCVPQGKCCVGVHCVCQ